MQQQDIDNLLELLAKSSESLREKLHGQKVFDAKEFFWKRYIELLDKLDEIENKEDLSMLTEANLFRVLSILVPYWQELKMTG